MTKELKQEILDLSSLIFDDKIFTKIKSCVEQGDFNKLRLLITDEIELLEIALITFPDDAGLLKELELCNRIEDVVLDYCITTLDD